MNSRLDDPVQSREMIRLEQDVFVPLAGSRKLYICHTNKFWSQIKSAGYVIFLYSPFISQILLFINHFLIKKKNNTI